jgi:glycosyltransferase involved in cell wall biosynthesis
MTRWAVLTGEYPPQPGGVSDYTRLVAVGLAAGGDEVAVFCPSNAGGADPIDPGVTVCRLPDHFGPRGLFRLERILGSRPAPDRILIQYVPHAFGFKAMNVPFAAWVASRASCYAPVWVMFHEVAFPFSWRPPAHTVLGAATWLMARLVAGAADRILVSVPAWVPTLRRICPQSKKPQWVPVPCNVATTADPTATAEVRRRYIGNDVALIGHFGTFAPHVAAIFEPAAARILTDSPKARMLLIGRGSDQFQRSIVQSHSELADRVASTGGLPETDVAAHLRACDLLLQPSIDGVSTRRGSVMAALANGVPVVTNLGHASEPLWTEGTGVIAVKSPDANAVAAAALQILALPPSARAEMGLQAASLYQSRFSLRHTLEQLRETRPAAGR